MVRHSQHSPLPLHVVFLPFPLSIPLHSHDIADCKFIFIINTHTHTHTHTHSLNPPFPPSPLSLPSSPPLPPPPLLSSPPSLHPFLPPQTLVCTTYTSNVAAIQLKLCPHGWSPLPLPLATNWWTYPLT